MCSTSFFHKAEIILQIGPKKHNTWKKDSMLRAVMAIRKKEMGLLRTSKVFEFPKSTLKDKVKSTEQGVEN
jgi:hypothetical protein